MSNDFSEVTEAEPSLEPSSPIGLLSKALPAKNFVPFAYNSLTETSAR